MTIDIERVRQVIEARKQKNEERTRKAQQSSPTPAKPKYEYSTDNLSMLDMSGMGSTAMVNVLADTAQDVTAYAKGSNAYYKYLASDEEKKQEAKRISIETGIPVNALLYSDENMATGRSVQEYTKKRMALAPEGINDWDDMNAVYEKFPGLKAIIENPNMSDNDVAIAMHNIEDLTKAKSAAEAFSLGYAADKANYRIGEIGMIEFLGGEMTPEMKKEIASIKKSIPEQKSAPNFFDDPWVAIAGGTGANIYHMNKGFQRGAVFATTALSAGVTASVMSGGTLTVPAMGAAITTAGIGVRYGMTEDMFLNSAGRHYAEYSEMRSQSGKKLLTNNEARVFAAIAAGIEAGVEFWNYGQVMNLLGVNYKREIMEIVAKASGDQNMLKAGFAKFLKERGAQIAKTTMTEVTEEAVQDIGDKAVHNAIVTYAPQSAHRKYTGTEFAKGALEASAEALPGIIGLGMIGGTVSNIKSVRDFAKMQKEQNDIFVAEMKLSNGLALIKNLQENMATSKLYKKNPDIYQAVVKGAVENTEFKEVRVDTELALQDEEGAQVFNQLVEEMGLEQEEVNAIIENKADLVVPTEIYAQTVINNDKFDQYISFDEKGHSVARKKYYMAVAEDMAKSISLEQEEQQAELIDGIITANFPEAGIEQDMGAAIILANPSNPKTAWKQMKHDTETAINARLGSIVKKLEEGMSRGVHHYYSGDSAYSVKRMSDNDAWYGDFYKQNKRKPNKAELLDMARDIYKGNGMKYGMAEYQFEATDEMQEDFDALDQDFANMEVLDSIKGKIDNLTAGEMAVVKGLSPSGYKVYQSVKAQFANGNKDVQESARMNAILFARYADRMADNIAKITGKPYTAEDYMRERTSIVADATEVDEGAFNHAMKREYFPSMKAFDKAFWEAPKKSKIGNWIKTKNGNEIIVSGSSYEHIQTGKHPLTIEQWQAVVDSVDEIKNIESITTVEGQKGSFGGFPVGAKIKTPLGKAGAILEFMPNGKVFLVTVVYNNEKALDNWIKNKKNSHTLEVGDMMSQNRIMGSSFINIIQDMFDIVKTTYDQTAYHGSPHTFDTFDLGAIGTGEGGEAHGWYNQSVRGQTKISGMSRVVSLFEAADKSTFVHELGHVALADLKLLAEMEGAPEQLVRDWQTVKEWLGYKDSQGFTREQHEKFARGFEAYLRSGEAPVRGLRSVFRKFKKWLCDIYADFVQLGGKPSPEIQAVMARMLASEQEIEAEAKLHGIESITKKKGMNILDDTTQAMYERWVYEAKEEAKEKVMKIAMKDVSDQMEEGRQEIIKAMRDDIEENLKQMDIFRAEECVRLSGSTAILPTLGYTEESYRAELEMYGGSLEKAIEQEVAKAVADMDSYTEVNLEAEAEKALSSSKYKAMLLTLEYEALERKEAEESRLDKSVDKALDAIEKSLRGEEAQPKSESNEVKSLKQKIADLKYTYRWREAELKLINQMQKQAAQAEAKQEKEEAVAKAVGEAKAKAEQDKEKILATVKQLKETIAHSKDNIRLVRDAVEGQTKLYRHAVGMNLMYMPIRQATAVAAWRHKERMKGAEVVRLMAKGEWQEAKQAKREQVMFSYFADESAKLKADVERKVNKLKKRSKSIAKGNVKLAVDERYFYNHLLYVFGINRRDAVVPSKWNGSKSVEDMFKRYAEGYEQNFMDENGKLDIPDYIKNAAGGSDVYRTQVGIVGRKNPVQALGYGALTKNEWDGLYSILTSVYTIGKNANRLYTVVDENGKEVSYEDAVQRIADGIRENVKIKKNNDPTGMTLKEWYEKHLDKGKDLFHDLVKPETFFLRNDGGKEGISMHCLYNPLKHASDKELRMQAEAAKEIKRLFDELGRKGLHKKQYKLGTSILTKEQVIVLALNWGTEINRKRILDTYKKPDEQNQDIHINLTEKDIEEVLGNLTAEDWRFVTGIWRLVGSYWKETVAVEERMTGVTLKKQEATPFTIVGNDGSVHHLAGGYYPIMYDPTKSIQAENQQNDDLAKQKLSGNAVLATRQGHTKERSEGTVEREIHTTLIPLNKHLGNVIHNICFREAVRDVNKLINSREVRAAFIEAYGKDVYGDLQKWVKDNWAMDESNNGFSQIIASLRRNTTVAVLSFRTSTAFLNLANIGSVIEYIGAGRLLSGVLSMRDNPFRIARWVCSKSAFVANRTQTMDRDVRERLAKESSSKLGKVKDAFDARAFQFIAFTDMMLAIPTWKIEYDRVYREGVEKGLDPNLIERQAVDAGDAAVRRVFGSGEVKDLAPIQRGNEAEKMFTMYYSYMNTVFNAIELRRGRWVDAKERIKFFNAVFLWGLVPALITAFLRALISDDEDLGEAWVKRIPKEVFGQLVGVFPLARDLFSAVIDLFIDRHSYGVKTTGAFDAFTRTYTAFQTIKSKKKDKIDAGRDITRAINTYVGFSDTITDGIWTFFRYWDNDFDNEVGEVIKAIIFDKKIK